MKAVYFGVGHWLIFILRSVLHLQTISINRMWDPIKEEIVDELLLKVGWGDGGGGSTRNRSENYPSTKILNSKAVANFGDRSKVKHKSKSENRMTFLSKKKKKIIECNILEDAQEEISYSGLYICILNRSM